MSSSRTTASSFWATMAKGNNTHANKVGHSAVHVTMSDSPVADTWSLPEGTAPTIVSSGIPSNASAISDDSSVPTTPASKQDEEHAVIGMATIARRARGKTIVIGNSGGTNNQHCLYCEKNGHLQRDCPIKAVYNATERAANHEAFLERQARREGKHQAYLERAARRNNAVCFHCGETGHTKPQCVNPSKKEQAQAALTARVEFAMAEGMTYEEACAGESALAAYEARSEEARLARAKQTRTQRKATEVIVGADGDSYELAHGGIVAGREA